MLRIAHHIPGRIRLALSASSNSEIVKSAFQSQSVVNAFSVLPGIRQIRLNLMARSCTVEYDPKHIPPAGWEHVVAGIDSPDADVLINILNRGSACL